MSSDPIRESQKDISSQDEFVTMRLLKETFNISISGSPWVGTVTLQRSFDGQNWLDVEAFTANTERVGDDPEKSTYYRLGFKTGEYSSGTATVRISQ